MPSPSSEIKMRRFLEVKKCFYALPLNTNSFVVRCTQEARNNIPGKTCNWFLLQVAEFLQVRDRQLCVALSKASRTHGFV
jgi:hypothetical protein